jgi:hypothetical protein
MHNFYKIIWVVCIISQIILVGCSNWQDKYNSDFISENAKAVKTCEDYGQKYLQHYLIGSEWRVICYQESPYKTFVKTIKSGGVNEP